MSLFKIGTYKLHSGQTSSWIIDCSALTDDDWDWAAKYVSNYIKFKSVEGVPNGGLKFAKALEPYLSKDGLGVLLIVDDVLTTGASMEAQRAGRRAQGFVLFDRRERFTSDLTWIRAIWNME